MEVGCSRNVGHRRPHLAPSVDHVNSEGVHSIAPDIVPVDSGDEDLALVVVAKQPTDHGVGGCEGQLILKIQILPAASLTVQCQCREGGLAVTDTGRYSSRAERSSHKIEY